MTILKRSAWLWILSLCLLALPAGAEMLHMQGEVARAAFYSVDASGCVFTSVVVEAAPGLSQGSGGGGTKDRAALVILKWSECGGPREELFSGVSVVPALPDGALETQGHLVAASLNYSFEIVDDVGGGVWTVPVSLTWQADGEIERSKTRLEMHSPSFNLRRWTVGTRRNAAVTGSILLDGQELAVLPASNAELELNRHGRLTVTRQ